MKKCFTICTNSAGCFWEKRQLAKGDAFCLSLNDPIMRQNFPDSIRSGLWCSMLAEVLVLCDTRNNREMATAARDRSSHALAPKLL